MIAGVIQRLNTVTQVADDEDDHDDDERTEERVAVAGDTDTQQLNGLLNECIILLRAVMAQVDFSQLLCFQLTCQCQSK